MTVSLDAPPAPPLGRKRTGSGAWRTVEKLVRTAGTGFLFGLFGLGALVLAGLILPALGVVVRGPRDLVAQSLIHRAHAFFLRVGTLLRLWSVEFDGLEKLRGARGSLIVANHPTLIDVVLLLSRLPQADCVVKRAAWRNPFHSRLVRAADYIPNDFGEAVVECCSERLRSGRNVILFPEGSRSPMTGLNSFQRGAAHVLLRSECWLVPVTIRCEPPALKKGQPWWALPNEKLRFRVSVGDPLNSASFGVGGLARSAATRRVTERLEEYFLARVL